MTAGDPQVPESEITKDMRAFQEGWSARGEFDRLRVTTDDQAPVRCGAETSTRWPDYMTYSCMLPKGHPASHENPAGRISWTDGDCWWPDESALEPAGEADDELEDWQCRACGRADYDHPRLVSDHVFERAGEEKGAEAPQSHERRSSADTSSIARPAPSSGMPGLTEARTYWNVRRDGSGGWTYSRNGPSHHAWVLPEIEAAIAAEARAPLEERIEFYKRACAETEHEVQQILGKALAYPRYKDDQVNFPGATEADGVEVGEHIAATLALEIARQLAAVTAERDEANARSRRWYQRCLEQLDKAEESERQRDEALAALAEVRDIINVAETAEEFQRAFDIADRLLTPPASTAAEGD